MKTKDNRITDVRDIDISLIDSFPNHPFKVIEDDKMLQLTESIMNNGLLYPVLVREKADSRYEMIAGHRRTRATELAGKSKIHAMVCNYDDDTAAIVMVESNIHQRENILPSEKAFAYKILYEAMKHQGKRTDLTCAPVGHKSRDELSEKVGESREQIRRYIRLTNLVPELLDFVDEGKIGMRPAVEMSYLDEDSQRDIVDFIDENECFPSHAQTIQMRKLFTEGKLETEKISEIMSEEKGNQHEKLVFRGDRVKKLLPKSLPANKTEEYICKALEYYNRFLQRQRNRDER